VTADAGHSRFDPEIVVLYCARAVSDSALTEASPSSGFAMRSTMLPCSCKVEVPHLLRILERGADAVEVVACPDGKCRSLVGSARAARRIAYARRLLDEARIGCERLGISFGGKLSPDELVGLAAARAEAVRPLGPNPMKKGPHT
jgi:coenzyme F420-reducing hydrogenase delta subunit